MPRGVDKKEYEPHVPIVKLLIEYFKAGCIAGELPKSKPLKTYRFTKSTPNDIGVSSSLFSI